MKRLKLLLALIAALCLLNFGQLGYYKAKALLAQHFLEQAWSDSQASPGKNIVPWPWADISPQLKLSFGSKEFIVLADTSGESLAFGPGLLTAKRQPGTSGNTIIAGHRDTHFKFLEQVKNGDRFKIENKQGLVTEFKVDQIQIVDSSIERPMIEMAQSRLTLVTCYPFDMNVTNPNLRFLVSGIKVQS